MKYASYILSGIAVVLLFNIFLSYSSVTYRGFLKDTKDKMMGVSKNDVIEKMSKDQMEINTKILNSIDKLNENLDNLSKNKQSISTISSSGETQSGVTTTIPAILDMPGTLVTKLLPKINPLKVENTGVFDIKKDKAFEELKYITYNDSKKRVKVFIFEKSYDELKTLFKSNTTYKFNESDNFFGYSFYLNPSKTDIKIRFVTQLEGKAVGFEVYKNNYELLKDSLLN